MNSITREEILNIQAYKRLKKACNKLSTELGHEDYADEFYQENKGYYNWVNMSQKEMENHLRKPFETFIKQYDQ